MLDSSCWRCWDSRRLSSGCRGRYRRAVRGVLALSRDFSTPVMLAPALARPPPDSMARYLPSFALHSEARVATAAGGVDNI